VGETVRWRDRAVAFESLAAYRNRPRLIDFANERPFTAADSLSKALPSLPVRDLSPAGATALGRVLHRLQINGVAFLRERCRDYPADYFLHRQLALLSPADRARCEAVCAMLR
jgi:hypothetical protein